jgi:hypothetical protein
MGESKSALKKKKTEKIYNENASTEFKKKFLVKTTGLGKHRGLGWDLKPRGRATSWSDDFPESHLNQKKARSFAENHVVLHLWLKL